jgi:predicted metal-dependent hydrolase
MAEEGVVHVGETTIRYEVVRSHRRRRTMEIVVDGRDGVRVSVPLQTPEDEVATFVSERARWIARHAAAVEEHGPSRWESGEHVRLLGRPIELRVEPAAVAFATAYHDGERLLVDVPDLLDPDARPEAAREAVLAWLRVRADRLLRGRTERWAEHLRLYPHRVIVKEQRRRWGSCSREGTIRLNWRIVMAEPALIDYVIVHEMIHLLVRNHSPFYWLQVGRVLPDYDARRNRLQELSGAFDL